MSEALLTRLETSLTRPEASVSTPCILLSVTSVFIHREVLGTPIVTQECILFPSMFSAGVEFFVQRLHVEMGISKVIKTRTLCPENLAFPIFITSSI
jgi:hypothetical protein